MCLDIVRGRAAKNAPYSLFFAFSDEQSGLQPGNASKPETFSGQELAMLVAFQIATLLLVSIAMAMSVGHALEMPGKMRLEKDAYLTVQPIYYPGFTIAAGFGEFGGMLATAALLVVTPQGPAFQLTAAALALLILAHIVYWLVTHPTNRFWLKDQKLAGAGATFFDVGKRDAEHEPDWKVARKRWEYSHVARAVLHFAGVALLAAAIAAT
jgi:hypothetical protein